MTQQQYEQQGAAQQHAMRSPEYRSRCAYCGEPEVEAWQSCCGERHFTSETPECPCCGDDVEQASGVSSSGVEYSVWHCQSCNWESDPE